MKINTIRKGDTVMSGCYVSLDDETIRILSADHNVEMEFTHGEWAGILALIDDLKGGN